MADAAPKTQTKAPYEHEIKRSRFFLYKAALATVFLVVVPLFPSLAPDFFSQTLHARSWELLQLILVGIVVSYGLFSNKNEEPTKTSKADHHSSSDQSYVSKLLQVSSVFDDDDSTVIEESSRFQALSSRYYRGEPPVLVVAKEDPDADERNGVVSRIRQKPKPLLLPVRSLKQRVPSPNSRNSPNSTGSGKSNVEKEEAEEEEAVLRSPIPWRSRSGRMEMKEINNNEGIPSPSKEERELDRSFRANPNPKISSQTLKTFAPPPPAPPPPPSPAFLRKSVLMKSNSTLVKSAAFPTEKKKALERSARSVPGEEALREARFRGGGGDDPPVRSARRFKVNDQLVEDDLKEKEKIVMDNATDEDEEEEEESDEFDEERFGAGGSSSSSSSRNVEAASDDNGRDVDKKADEFIAKFREQIRLQRIESIRRSTAQRAGKICR